MREGQRRRGERLLTFNFTTFTCTRADVHVQYRYPVHYSSTLGSRKFLTSWGLCFVACCWLLLGTISTPVRKCSSQGLTFPVIMLEYVRTPGFPVKRMISKCRHVGMSACRHASIVFPALSPPPLTCVDYLTFSCFRVEVEDCYRRYVVELRDPARAMARVATLTNWGKKTLRDIITRTYPVCIPSPLAVVRITM
jgi:hypothetical protein